VSPSHLFGLLSVLQSSFVFYDLDTLEEHGPVILQEAPHFQFGDAVTYTLELWLRGTAEVRALSLHHQGPLLPVMLTLLSLGWCPLGLSAVNQV
jgi:hypothetical protein